MTSAEMIITDRRCYAIVKNDYDTLDTWSEVAAEIWSKLQQDHPELRRLKSPTGHEKIPAAAIFWKQLVAKVSAWTWRVQHWKFMILEISGQAVFFRCIFSE